MIRHTDSPTPFEMDFEWLEDMLPFEMGLPVRQYRERRNPFELYGDTEFRLRYRLSKETAKDIVHLLLPSLEHDTARSYSLSPDLQFLCALRFFSCGTFQGVNADIFNVHRTTVGRCIKRVLNGILEHRHDYIRFPDDLTSVKQQFYSYGSMPGVVGCIDGTHVPIRRPKHQPQPEVFRCRKGFFSINAQVVAGPDHKLYDVVARWPGSTHDSRVFSNSRLKSRLDGNEIDGILLADAGYACTK